MQKIKTNIDFNIELGGGGGDSTRRLLSELGAGWRNFFIHT